MSISRPTQDGQWTSVIRPKSGWLDINMREAWHYRDLVMMFVQRDLVAQYKQTILGPLWYAIQPILSTLVFTLVFSKIARIPTDSMPPFLFYMAGTVAWSYFANCLTTTSSVFVTNASIFGKVYFPRICVPVATVTSNLLTFLIQFCLFLGFCAYFKVVGVPIKFTAVAWLLPLFVLQMALLGLGFGILVSSLTTKYRDLTFLVSFGVQLWMYATPIVYPLSIIPEKYRIWFLLNPMTSIIQGFRAACLGTGTITPSYIAAGWVLTIAVLCLGIVLFSRIEKTFMDTV